MKTLFPLNIRIVAAVVSMCLAAQVQAQIGVSNSPVILVDGSTPGYYNSALGTVLDGTSSQFPFPFPSGADPVIFPAAEPDLAPAANILGNWLTPNPVLNSNWSGLSPISSAWPADTETAIIYVVDGGVAGFTNVLAQLDVDNGVFVWVNGQYRFGALSPGLPSPSGQFEYTNIVLGALAPGMNYIQILREDHGISAGYQVQISGTPNPAASPIAVTLANATATFSQINPTLGWDFGVSKSINGTIADNLGWGIAVHNQLESITNQIAVFETVNNVGFAGGSRISFTIQQAHGIDFVFHTIGRLRLSVTTDDRSTFADGLETGGDVTANWTVLNPDTMISSNGATLTKLNDLSVLASGTSPQTDTYFISALTSLTGITGIRIEVLEDPSLPNSGPGRQPLNGNFVLSELNVEIAPASTHQCAPVMLGMISWWRGEGNGLDAISTNAGTLLNGASFSDGKVGQTFRFDGENDHVRIPYSPTTTPTNAMTVDAWVYPTALGGFREIITKWDAVGGINQRSFSFKLYPDGRVTFGASPTGTDFLSTICESTNSLPLNQWTYVAGIYDGVALKIFVNGVQENSVPYSLGIFPGTTDIAIGGVVGGNPFGQVGAPFAGLIDEPSLYNRALTASEIASIYAADSSGKCGGPIPPVVNCTPAPSGAFAWWQAESNTLSSVGGGAGVFAAPGFASGKAGLAFDFNGANNIVIPDQPSFNPTNALTIECWVYPRTLTTSYAQDIISKDGEFSGPRQYMLTMGPPPGLDNGTGGFRAHVGVPGGFPFIDGATSIQTNTWYHVAMTYDGTSLKLFVNGALDAQMAVTGGVITSSQPIRLGGGAPAGDPPYFFNGLLDEATLYSRALSSNEIVAIYNAGSAGKCPPAFVPTPPVITQHPQDRTVNANATAQFSVTATGSPTLRYQWFFADNPLLDQTNATLSIANALPANQGIYRVTVSNDFGFAESKATLTVLTFPPVITRQPTNLTVIVGNSATFSVQATGSVTLAYQWLSNGIPMPGRTSTSLPFQSVQFSNAANYSVIVTNPYGAVTSSVAVLTVNPIPPCVSVHDGLVSWWKGENNAIDNWDSNNGSSPFGNSSTTGKVGLTWRTALISVNDSASLRITNGLTIESWINPFSLTSVRVILSKFEYPAFQPFGTQSAYLLGATNNGLFFTLTPNGSVRTNTTLVSTNVIPLNQWTHVAATYDGAVMRLYINGSQVAQTNYTGKIFPGSAPLGIGGFPVGTSSPWQFSGLIDEPSLYNRALSAAEIQSIFAADLSGKCPAAPVVTRQPSDQIVPLGEDARFSVEVFGSRPLAYQWYFNGAGPQNRIIGATNATLILERVRTNNVGSYFVTVSNIAGTNFSARAFLNTLPAPSCVDTPPDLISWWPGDANTLDVTGLNNIVSYTPLNYPTGKVATAFTFNGISSRAQVNSSTSLNFTNNQSFSIETWIKAANTNSSFANVPLIEKRDSFTTGWLGYSLSLNNGRLAFALGARPFSQLVTNALFVSSSADLRDGLFHHVAVTVDRAAPNGGVLYVDGAPVMVFDTRAFTNTLFNQSPLLIGGPTTTLSNSYFNGLIDEPAIYGRALTPAEILSIHTAGAAGRCKTRPAIVVQPVGGAATPGQPFTLSVQATGTAPLRYQWRRNTANVVNATNSILTLTNVTPAIAGTYSVVVLNAFGSVTSSNAVVITNNLPPIAFPGQFAVNEDSSNQIVFNATDPDNNPLTYFIATPPTNGVLIGSEGSRFRMYLPKPNYNGPDSFTYKANDGFTDSSNVLVTIIVRPVNDAPTATSQEIATDEDVSLVLALQGGDVDGDLISYEIVQQPVNGSLTGTLPNLTYTPAQNYSGSDYFTYITRDPSNAVSQLAAVVIAIRPVNDAPIPRIVVTPLDLLPGETNTVLISPVCCDTTLVLDGSQSSDAENEPLTYIWMDGTNIIGNTATLTNQFAPGVHEFTLVVGDGFTEAAELLVIEIIKAQDAVCHLQALVEASPLNRNERAALANWLRVASQAFERCNVDQGTMFLERFEERVAARVAPNHPAFAEKWTAISTAIRAVAGLCDPADRPCHDDDKDKDRDKDKPRGDKSDGERGGHDRDNRDSSKGERAKVKAAQETAVEAASSDTVRVGKSSPR